VSTRDLLLAYASDGGGDEGGLRCSTSLDGVAVAAELLSCSGLLCWPHPISGSHHITVEFREDPSEI
jgi:hypothetical protein